MTTLTTARLRLEPYAERHFDGLHAMNRLPEVMRYITGQPMSADDTRASIARVQAAWAAGGPSWWAFVRTDTGQVVGAGTLQPIERKVGNPIEVGWRLHPDHWGQGYATEAAIAMRDWAFERLRVPELMALCQAANTPSSAVMKRLGMAYRGVQHWYGKGCEAYGLTAEMWCCLTAAGEAGADAHANAPATSACIPTSTPT